MASGDADRDSEEDDAPTTHEPDANGAWTQLFNGRNLEGWDTYLGPPHEADDAGRWHPGSTPIGLNLDPERVFSVVNIDGASAIQISGQFWGALTTIAEYENYHLFVEYKWGSRVWPQLGSRDSGLLYHSIGAFGAVEKGGASLAEPPGSAFFMTSMELQIAQGDVGSYYALGPIAVDGGVFFLRATSQREQSGKWNTIEVYTASNESLHVVNGVVVAHPRNAVHAVGGEPFARVARGKIQLQSEAAEIYFRTVRLEHIERLPDLP
ncbi:MAG TPA: DUF1080 domain-containing protein [Polyangiaceae bacterium]|nr:DUF1080 domain-containing protein [Polyangiaceae bacterium]